LHITLKSKKETILSKMKVNTEKMIFGYASGRNAILGLRKEFIQN